MKIFFQLGEVLAVLGESKVESTLLEIVYGLLHIPKGRSYGEKTRSKHNLIPGETFTGVLTTTFDLVTHVFQKVAICLTCIRGKERRVNELLK